MLLQFKFEEVNPEKKTTRIIWSHPGNDVTGVIAKSQKVAGTCEKVQKHFVCQCLSVFGFEYLSKIKKRSIGYIDFNSCSFKNSKL